MGSLSSVRRAADRRDLEHSRIPPGSSLTRASVFLCYLALSLSPFYFWSSGYPQVAHMLMGIAIAIQLLRGKIMWEKWWMLLVFFVSYATTVNLVVYAKYLDLHLLMSGIFYAFNSMVWICLISLCERVGTGRFLRAVERILWGLLAAEILLVATPLGRTYGGYRSMGTFNDPNQMAHWFIWVAVCLGAVGWVLHHSWISGIVALGVTAVAVAFSASRSGALGLLVLAMVYGLMALRSGMALAVAKHRIRSRVLLLILVFFVTLPAILILVGQNTLEPLVSKVASAFSNLVQRFEDHRFTTLESRGYDRLWKFPEFLIFGAGEGVNVRWAERTWFLGEIHSTFAGVLFYYGLPGFISLTGFLYCVWIRLSNSWMKLLLLVPLLYSLATYNLRNWFFWVGIAVLYVAARHEARGIAVSHRESV